MVVVFDWGAITLKHITNQTKKLPKKQNPKIKYTKYYLTVF